MVDGVSAVAMRGRGEAKEKARKRIYDIDDSWKDDIFLPFLLCHLVDPV